MCNEKSCYEAPLQQVQLMAQFRYIIEVWASGVSDDEEEIPTQTLMINTCESSHYLGQLQTADTKQSIRAQ